MGLVILERLQMVEQLEISQEPINMFPNHVMHSVGN
jgi:hypothetical protein